MKPMDYYTTHKCPYPSPEIKRSIRIEEEEILLTFKGTKAEIDEKTKEIDEAVKSRVREVRNDYTNEECDLKEEFKRDLFVEYGVANNPKREECFYLAWEHGHSSGYSEVYNYFSYFVKLID